MTGKDLAKFIGKTGLWTVNAGAGVKVEVKISDARLMFGRIDVLVTPAQGSGEVWVDSQFVDDIK